MKYTFICYPKCTTCQKAKKWLDDSGIDYEVRHIKDENPSETELRKWYNISNRPLKGLFNTSGLQYRSLELSKKLPSMSEDEQFSLLASDGMLVKRPILVTPNRVIVGFKEAEWNELLK